MGAVKAEKETLRQNRRRRHFKEGAACHFLTSSSLLSLASPKWKQGRVPSAHLVRESPRQTHWAPTGLASTIFMTAETIAVRWTAAFTGKETTFSASLLGTRKYYPARTRMPTTATQWTDRKLTLSVFSPSSSRGWSIRRALTWTATDTGAPQMSLLPAI